MNKRQLLSGKDCPVNDNINLPAIKKAEELTITFPSNDLLEPKEQNVIQNAITKGGIVASEGRCYIDTKEMPKLLVTDNKGVAKIYNNAQEDDKYENGNNQYLSTSEIKKNIDERIQEPRGALEQEKLRYSETCLNAFRDSPELEKERHIEADRIAKERPLLTNKKIKAENIDMCQLSGEKFEDDARGHHIERVADNPRKARNLDNIVVVKAPIHVDIHNKGAESPEELKKYIETNNYNKPNNLE